LAVGQINFSFANRQKPIAILGALANDRRPKANDRPHLALSLDWGMACPGQGIFLNRRKIRVGAGEVAGTQVTAQGA
jgi:hypothetical protein